MWGSANQVPGAQLTSLTLPYFTLPYLTLPYLRRTLVKNMRPCFALSRVYKHSGMLVRFRHHPEMFSTPLRFWMGEAAHWSET